MPSRYRDVRSHGVEMFWDPDTTPLTNPEVDVLSFPENIEKSLREFDPEFYLKKITLCGNLKGYEGLIPILEAAHIECDFVEVEQGNSPSILKLKMLESTELDLPPRVLLVATSSPRFVNTLRMYKGLGFKIVLGCQSDTCPELTSPSTTNIYCHWGNMIIGQGPFVRLDV